MKKLIAFLAFLLLASPVWATNYYVNSASSGGNGTTTATSGTNAAFATVAAAQAALTGDQSDNFLLFNKGQTWAATLTLAAYGTSGHPFTVGAYGTGDKPAIGTGNTGIEINNKSYITIDGLALSGAIRGVYAHSVSNGLIIQNNTISGQTTVNSMTGCVVLNGSSNTLIYNNTCSGSYKGINISGYKASTGILNDSITIRGNTVSTIQSAGINIQNGDITAPITDGIKPTNIIIENNDVSEAGILATGIDTAGIHTLMNGDGLIIRFNRVHNCGLDPTTVRGSGIMVDEDGGTAEVYYNVVYSNSQSGISTTTDGTKIYNNTIYDNREGIALFHSGQGYEAIGCLIKNNIVVQTSTKPYTVVSNRAVTAGASTWSNNVYYGSSNATPFGYNNADGNWAGNHSFADWQGHVTDGGSSVADPLFVSAAGGDFHLQGTSPARHAGTNVGLTTDYDVRFVKPTPDIGAYQYPSGRRMMKIGNKWR